MHYLIGDIQGCCDAFNRLLVHIGFSASRDSITVLGDVVNRGPSSLKTLRRLRELGESAQVLLGNHDLHLLAVAAGVRPLHATDTLNDILQAPDRDEWIAWVQQRPLAVQAQGWLCVHAGVLPQWTAAQTLQLSAELSGMLQGSECQAFLPQMYGNEPAIWSEELEKIARWRCAINALTRLRYCHRDGSMDFKVKEGKAQAPDRLVPWFEMPNRKTAQTPIAFGHWSTLGLINQPHLLSIDTGCVWGGSLTAVRVDGGRREVYQVSCETQPD